MSADDETTDTLDDGAATKAPKSKSVNDRRRREIQIIPSGNFRKQVAHPARPGVRVSVTGESAAEVYRRAQHIAELRRDVNLGLRSPKDAARGLSRELAGAYSVADCWRAYELTLLKRWRTNAQSLWKNHFLETSDPLAKLKVWELDDVRLEKWKREQTEAGYSPKTIANAWHCLSRAVRLAYAAGKVPELPWREFRPPKNKGDAFEREACRSVDEVMALLAACIEHDERCERANGYSDLRFRVLLAALCGFRQGEIGGLGWDDVDLEVRGWLWVRHQVTDGWRREHPEWDRPKDPPKDGERNFQLHVSALHALRVLRTIQQQAGLWRPDGPVFPATRGKTRGAWRGHADAIDPDVMRACVRRAGLPNVEKWSPHSLRHSFATLEVLASNGDLRAVMARTGHSSVEMLQRYLHRGGRGAGGSFVAALPLEAMSAVAGANGPTIPAPPDTEPELPGPDNPASLLRLPESVAAVGSRALVDLVEVTREHAEAFEKKKQARREAKLKKKRAARAAKTRAAGKPLLNDLARAWLAEGGGAGVRPLAVTAMADASYRKKYHQALKRGATVESAQFIGRRARAGTLGAWEKALRRVSALRAAPSEPTA